MPDPTDFGELLEHLARINTMLDRPLACTGFAGSVAAQWAITVNGHWLSPEQATVADMNAGFPLPDGHYYCDPASGLWGRVGSEPVGRVEPHQCPPPAGYNGGSGDGYVERGPFGNSGSDCGMQLPQRSGDRSLGDDRELLIQFWAKARLVPLACRP